MFRRVIHVLRSLIDATREPTPYPLTRTALANLRDTLADWAAEVEALADVELAEMTRGES